MTSINSNRVRYLAYAAAFALPSAVAMAADEGGAGSNPQLLAKPETAVPAMVSAIVMFLLLFWLLKRMAWGPILKGLTDREVKIRTEIESAENAREQANAALEEYQKELAHARAEANQMITQARADAQAVADELRAKNAAEVASLKDRAREDIESAKRQALSEIYGQASMMATMVAGKILEREIKAEDHAKLVEDSLTQLDTMNEN